MKTIHHCYSILIHSSTPVAHAGRNCIVFAVLSDSSLLLRRSGGLSRFEDGGGGEHRGEEGRAVGDDGRPRGEHQLHVPLREFHLLIQHFDPKQLHRRTARCW